MSAEEALWPALIAWKREVTGESAIPLTPEDIAAIRAATIQRWKPTRVKGPITLNTAMELIGHEAIVLEWYRDSEGVGTWGIGVTNASGHLVDRYKNNPQTIERCLEVYLWLLQTKYLPDVSKAFAGFALTEAQLAAALSFHYNTGAIGRTDWVTLFKDGHPAAARDFLQTHYIQDGRLKDRRMQEAALFFDGKWSNDGKATIYPVLKPSYRPDFKHPERVDIRPILTGLLSC